MVHVREVPADDPRAIALLTEYFAARAAGFPGGGYRTMFPDPAGFQRPAGVFLALVGDTGSWVGCGGVRRLGDDSGDVRYEVKNLFVKPGARGAGGGRLLLSTLEETAITLGATAIVLDTHHSLEAAGRLYESTGFRQIAAYNDNPNATRWYEKRVNGHPATP